MAENEDTAATAVITNPADEHYTVQRLRAAFPSLDMPALVLRGQVWAVVPATLVVEVCTFLRDDPQMRYEMLLDVTAVDLLPAAPRWEVVYSFLSLSRNERFRLKVPLADGPDPIVPSVSGVWRSGNWYEREIYNLMGIRFSGHPDLRRLLMPEDWVGYPLRFDHPLGGEEVGFTS